MSKEPQQSEKMIKQISEYWHALKSADVISKLVVDREQGLTNAEAAQRIKSFGKNELEEAPPTSIWVKIYEQFANCRSTSFA